MHCCGQEMRIIYSDGYVYLWCMICGDTKEIKRQELEKEKQNVESNLVHDFS